MTPEAVVVVLCAEELASYMRLICCLGVPDSLDRFSGDAAAILTSPSFAVVAFGENYPTVA